MYRCRQPRDILAASSGFATPLMIESDSAETSNWFGLLVDEWLTHGTVLVDLAREAKSLRQPGCLLNFFYSVQE
jgi:hypothetical protein